MTAKAQADERHYFKNFVRSLGEKAVVIEAAAEVKASKITMLSPQGLTEEETKQLYEELSVDYNIIVHGTENAKVLTNGLVELMPYGYTKATGIQNCIKQLGIDWEATIGVGDSNNDLEMLHYVKVAVVMGNGSPQAKELATLITSHIDDHGIENAMKELFRMKL